jgi:hypothetical protein
MRWWLAKTKELDETPSDAVQDVSLKSMWYKWHSRAKTRGILGRKLPVA